MPKRAIYQRKVDGKWAVIELPDDDKDGDRLPLRAQRIRGLTREMKREPSCSGEQQRISAVIMIL